MRYEKNCEYREECTTNQMCILYIARRTTRRDPPPMKRIESLNQTIHEELARVIDRELEFPEGTLVTITRIETSDDKYHAKAFFSILGSASSEEVLNMLNGRIPFIQKVLNRRLRIRPIPKIRFLFDEEEKRRETVEKLLGEPDRSSHV